MSAIRGNTKKTSTVTARHSLPVDHNTGGVVGEGGNNSVVGRSSGAAHEREEAHVMNRSRSQSSGGGHLADARDNPPPLHIRCEETQQLDAMEEDDVVKPAVVVVSAATAAAAVVVGTAFATPTLLIAQPFDESPPKDHHGDAEEGEEKEKDGNENKDVKVDREPTKYSNRQGSGDAEKLTRRKQQKRRRQRSSSPSSSSPPSFSPSTTKTTGEADKRIERRNLKTEGKNNSDTAPKDTTAVNKGGGDDGDDDRELFPNTLEDECAATTTTNAEPLSLQEERYDEKSSQRRLQDIQHVILGDAQPLLQPPPAATASATNDSSQSPLLFSGVTSTSKREGRREPISTQNRTVKRAHLKGSADPPTSFLSALPKDSSGRAMEPDTLQSDSRSNHAAAPAAAPFVDSRQATQERRGGDGDGGPITYTLGVQDLSQCEDERYSGKPLSLEGYFDIVPKPHVERVPDVESHTYDERRDPSSRTQDGGQRYWRTLSNSQGRLGYCAENSTGLPATLDDGCDKDVWSSVDQQSPLQPMTPATPFTRRERNPAVGATANQPPTSNFNDDSQPGESAQPPPPPPVGGESTVNTNYTRNEADHRNPTGMGNASDALHTHETERACTQDSDDAPFLQKVDIVLPLLAAVEENKPIHDSKRDDDEEELRGGRSDAPEGGASSPHRFALGAVVEARWGREWFGAVVDGPMKGDYVPIRWEDDPTATLYVRLHDVRARTSIPTTSDEVQPSSAAQVERLNSDEKTLCGLPTAAVDKESSETPEKKVGAVSHGMPKAEFVGVRGNAMSMPKRRMSPVTEKEDNQVSSVSVKRGRSSEPAVVSVTSESTKCNQTPLPPTTSPQKEDSAKISSLRDDFTADSVAQSMVQHSERGGGAAVTQNYWMQNESSPSKGLHDAASPFPTAMQREDTLLVGDLRDGESPVSVKRNENTIGASPGGQAPQRGKLAVARSITRLPVKLLAVFVTVQARKRLPPDALDWLVERGAFVIDSLTYAIEFADRLAVAHASHVEKTRRSRSRNSTNSLPSPTKAGAGVFSSGGNAESQQLVETQLFFVVSGDSESPEGSTSTETYNKPLPSQLCEGERHVVDLATAVGVSAVSSSWLMTVCTDCVNTAGISGAMHGCVRLPCEHEIENRKDNRLEASPAVLSGTPLRRELRAYGGKSFLVYVDQDEDVHTGSDVELVSCAGGSVREGSGCLHAVDTKFDGILSSKRRSGSQWEELTSKAPVVDSAAVRITIQALYGSWLDVLTSEGSEVQLSVAEAVCSIEGNASCSGAIDNGTLSPIDRKRRRLENTTQESDQDSSLETSNAKQRGTPEKARRRGSTGYTDRPTLDRARSTRSFRAGDRDSPLGSPVLVPNPENSSSAAELPVAAHQQEEKDSKPAGESKTRKGGVAGVSADQRGSEAREGDDHEDETGTAKDHMRKGIKGTFEKSDGVLSPPMLRPANRQLTFSSQVGDNVDEAVLKRIHTGSSTGPSGDALRGASGATRLRRRTADVSTDTPLAGRDRPPLDGAGSDGGGEGNEQEEREGSRDLTSLPTVLLGEDYYFTLRRRSVQSDEDSEDADYEVRLGRVVGFNESSSSAVYMQLYEFKKTSFHYNNQRKTVDRFSSVYLSQEIAEVDIRDLIFSSQVYVVSAAQMQHVYVLEDPPQNPPLGQPMGRAADASPLPHAPLGRLGGVYVSEKTGRDADGRVNRLHPGHDYTRSPNYGDEDDDDDSGAGRIRAETMGNTENMQSHRVAEESARQAIRQAPRNRNSQEENAFPLGHDNFFCTPQTPQRPTIAFHEHQPDSSRAGNLTHHRDTTQTERQTTDTEEVNVEGDDDEEEEDQESQNCIPQPTPAMMSLVRRAPRLTHPPARTTNAPMPFDSPAPPQQQQQHQHQQQGVSLSSPGLLPLLSLRSLSADTAALREPLDSIRVGGSTVRIGSVVSFRDYRPSDPNSSRNQASRLLTLGKVVQMQRAEAGVVLVLHLHAENGVISDSKTAVITRDMIVDVVSSPKTVR